MSYVTCHMSNVTFFLDKVLKLGVGGSVINGATPSSLKTFSVISLAITSNSLTRAEL